jgi:hypothetical protein
MGYKDGHWSILFVTDDREEAVSEAKVAEAGKHIQAVKVVQESVDDKTGEERSKTIYSGGTQDGASPAHKKKVVKKSRAGGDSKKKDGKGQDGQGQDGEELHPELVTDFIDRIKMSVIVIGSISLVLVILAFAYLSNPEAVSGIIDGILN